MNIILLSGGSGKRLWPLSNEVRSKQFIKILKNPAGQSESMLQYIYRNLVSKQYEQERTEITIATSANQVSSIRAQLGDSVGISIEPCRRDTFPAIALATAYLHDVRGISTSEAVVVCPVDPCVENSYFNVIRDMYRLAQAEDNGIVLMGIAPTYPSAKYGYIIPASTENVSAVSEFKEKPDVPTAEKYIAAGAMWNGGVFAFRISYLLEKSLSLLGYSDYESLLSNYERLPKISFDYAVVEKEPNVTVIRYSGAWKDLGTWNTLTEAMSEPLSGNAVAPLSINTHVINELQLPLIALGVKDLAIAATPDGILVTDKKSSDKLKDYVTDNRPMYEKRLWGEYKVLDIFSTAPVAPTQAASTPVMVADSTPSLSAHSSDTAGKTNNPVNDCVYTHSEAADNAGKDRAEFSSNRVNSVNSADAVVAAQTPVGNTLNSSMAGEIGIAEQKGCPNIRDSRNIQTIKATAKTAKTVNTMTTDETVVSTVSNLAVTAAGLASSNALTKHLIIKPGNHISYQLHRHRSEVWTFIAGQGLLLLGDEIRTVGVGDVVKIAAGMKHGIMAMPAPSTAVSTTATNDGNAGSTDNALHIIEVQIGDDLTEEDIERFDWPISKRENA